MFEVVTAEPRAGAWRRKDALAVSAALHVMLVLAILNLPAPELPVAAPVVEETVTFMDVLSRMPPPLPALQGEDGTAGGSPGLERVASAAESAAREILSAPDQVADALPDVEPKLAALGGAAAAAAAAAAGVERIGEGVTGEEVEVPRHARAYSSEPVDVWMLAERPQVLNPRTMADLWSRLYPARLNFRGIGGEAVVSFVININGRVDPATVELIAATHPEFGQAALKGVRKLRFEPARLDGRPVRVRATLPVMWRPYSA